MLGEVEDTEQGVKTKKGSYRDWHGISRSRSLGSAFGFLVVIIIIVLPLVFIAMIKEVGRCGERPPASVCDVAKLELCFVNHSGSRLDINPFWWQKLLQLLKG